jgi:hypothetical protein
MRRHTPFSTLLFMIALLLVSLLHRHVESFSLPASITSVPGKQQISTTAPPSSILHAFQRRNEEDYDSDEDEDDDPAEFTLSPE